MFNLEAAIADWRKQLLATGIKSPVPLEELENHLRDGIERQMKSGMNEQEAFDFAVQQLGQAGALRKEFGKVGEVMSARQRKFNIIVCGVAAVLLGLTGVALLFMSFRKPPGLSLNEGLTVSGGYVSAALILWSWRFSYGFFPVLSKRMRIIVAFLCVVLSGLCAMLLLNFILSSTNTTVQFLTAAPWTMLPVWLAAGIIFALEEAAYRKTAASDL